MACGEIGELHVQVHPPQIPSARWALTNYARAAEAHGVRPLPALFETSGGVGPELYEFLVKAAEAVQNKLSKGE